ncbi:sigma-70 family RNA polymerase sigma factor [Galbibacter orientalis]|uniref:RNA polymerase sigma factor n=1 Tax=Galbibacter orientalis TaxID=453852 RepID=UPI0030804133
MAHTTFELLKNNDPAALVQIHAQYNRSIFWVGKRWLDDEFVIETLVQNVFLKLWVFRDRIETPKHIYFFLKFVMKRECFSYYSKPRNKFYRKVYSLENYENYQDYMVGYDPAKDHEHFQDQELEQKMFEKVKKVLPLLSDKRRHLIKLCLKYGFQYKEIGIVMGKSVTETSNEVKRAIEDLKTIIHQGGMAAVKKSPATGIKIQGVMTEEQKRVLELRCKEKQSFAFIANELKLSQKEVHKEFVAAYKLMQEKLEEQLKSA